MTLEEARAVQRWYADRSLLAARAFIAELDRAIELIGQNPSAWPTYVHGTRRYLLRRFPFSVVYLELDGEVEIVAIAHGRRRPGYWRGR